MVVGIEDIQRVGLIDVWAKTEADDLEDLERKGFF